MEQHKIFRREYNLGIIFSNSCYCYYSNRKNALEEFVSENKIKLKGEDKRDNLKSHSLAPEKKKKKIKAKQKITF